MPLTSSGLTPLSPHESLELLQTECVGRVVLLSRVEQADIETWMPESTHYSGPGVAGVEKRLRGTTQSSATP